MESGPAACRKDAGMAGPAWRGLFEIRRKCCERRDLLRGNLTNIVKKYKIAGTFLLNFTVDIIRSICNNNIKAKNRKQGRKGEICLLRNRKNVWLLLRLRLMADQP